MPSDQADEKGSLLPQSRMASGYGSKSGGGGGMPAQIAINPDQRDEEEEGGPDYGDYAKACIFGALDGVLTSFAIIAGASGGGLGTPVIVIVGVSNILADGLSMGIGEYLSSKAHDEYVQQERRQEEWVLSNERDRGINDIVNAYIKRGMSEEDATAMIGCMAKYDDILVDTIVTEQLGVPSSKGSTGECESLQEGVMMFLSFALAGLLPLVPYLLSPFTANERSASSLFKISCWITVFSLFATGAAKGSFGTRSWLMCGLETVLIGGACAGLAHEIGSLLQMWVGGEDEDQQQQQQ